ncbi:zinc finger, CCHC-type containing protein [Tanacetum coccineum]
MFVIEQPLPVPPVADSERQVLAQWNAVYDAYNEISCLILGSMTPELHRQFENSSPYDMIKELKSMFEKQVVVERFELIQTFYACKQEEGKPVGAYVLKMKDCVEQLKRLGYVLSNYNMHNMRKTVGELHALLIEYEKGLSKKAATPQVMAIQGGGIQKANKKSLNAKGKGKGKGKGKDKSYIPKAKNPKPSAKEHPSKDDACHHYKEVFKNEVKNQLGKTTKALRSDRGGEYISQEFKDYLKACGIIQQLTPPYTPQHNGVSERRNRTWLDMVRSMMNLTLPLSFWDYALDIATCISDTQKGNQWAGELEEIQDEDTSPSENTSEIPMEVEGFELPQEEVVPVHRSAKTHRAPDRLCLNVEVKEHSFGDLNEPANYKATILDPESDKWLDAMNVEMQSMKDNQVWYLVDLPPNLIMEYMVKFRLKGTPFLEHKRRVLRKSTKSRQQFAVFILDYTTLKMDKPNITMEEYIWTERKSSRRVFNDTLTSEAALPYEPTVDSLNNDEIDFRISFDESDDEDCTNEFSAIVYNDTLTSKSDFLTEPALSPQHINECNLKDETSFSKCDEEEQNVLYFNDLFPFNVIYPDDSKSDKDNDDDKIDIKQSPGGNVINTDNGAYAQRYQYDVSRGIDTTYRLPVQSLTNEYTEIELHLFFENLHMTSKEKKSTVLVEYLRSGNIAQ